MVKQSDLVWLFLLIFILLCHALLEIFWDRCLGCTQHSPRLLTQLGLIPSHSPQLHPLKCSRMQNRWGSKTRFDWNKTCRGIQLHYSLSFRIQPEHSEELLNIQISWAESQQQRNNYKVQVHWARLKVQMQQQPWSILNKLYWPGGICSLAKQANVQNLQ